MNVAIQPCGDSVAREHYLDTIARPVSRERIVPFLTSDQLMKFNEVCGEETAVWGVTPGKLGQNKRKWAKLAPGDVALLYRQGRIFSSARIVLTLQNERLASALWSRTEDNSTWEYIYFLDDLQERDISIDRFNRLLKYKPNNIVQGFQVYVEERAELLLELLGIDPDVTPPVPFQDPTEVQERLIALDSVDAPLLLKTRKEQSLLRTLLFESRISDLCAVCGRLFPVDLLVAAHIKRRADCSDIERRDINIVMRACKLGCDDLFERGYIYVDDSGGLRESAKLTHSTTDLQEAVKALLSRKVSIYGKTNSGYFKWHENHLPRTLRYK